MNSSRTIVCTAGILVEPPTRMPSSTSAALSPASRSAFCTGSLERSIRSATSCSNFERVKLICKCFGPLLSAVMNGRLISVLVELESSIFAFSAASLNLCKAILSEAKSIPLDFLNSLTIHSIIRWSKSSPPRCVSPFVDFTSNTPSPSSRIEISNVPPPRS